MSRPAPMPVRWSTFLPVVSLVIWGPPATAQSPERVWVASAIHAEVVVIDVASGEVTTTLRDLDGGLCGSGSTGFSDLVAGGGSVWALDQLGRVCRIDPETMRPTGGYSAPETIHSGVELAVHEGGVWVVGDPFFWRLDAEDLNLTDVVAVEYQEDAARDVAVVGGATWGLRRDGPWYLYRVPDRGGVRAPDSVRVSSAHPQALTSGLGGLWSYGQDEPSGMVLLRHDPVSGNVTGRIPIPNGVDWHDEPKVIAGEGYLWLGMGEVESIGRVDPETQAFAGMLDVGGYVWSIAVGASYVWVGVEPEDGGHQVVRIDPGALEIVDRVSIEGVPPRALAVR